MRVGLLVLPFSLALKKLKPNGPNAHRLIVVALVNNGGEHVEVDITTFSVVPITHL